MNTRRFVLHLIVGLLAFLLGVTAAVALGGFNPLERMQRTSKRQHAIPPQSLSTLEASPGRAHSCPSARLRVRRADRYSDNEQLIPAVPVEPVAPLPPENAPPPPLAPPAMR